MGQEKLERIVQKWSNDATFRKQMKADPEGTLQNAGFDLTDEEWAVLRASDWNAADEDFKISGPLGIIHTVCTLVKEK